MKPFRTIVTPGKPGFQLSHADGVVSIGSCFSENIGEKLREYKFNINVNPFGQQYNPHSVANAIHRLLRPVLYKETDLVYHDELYHSFDHHGSFSGADKRETLQRINENLLQASDDLKQASILFLTFGTAHVFRLKQTGEVVSNCHKLSGNFFDRALMTPVEIIEVLEKALHELEKVNDKIKVILTVSPVRYFAFGHYENSVSKAHLFTAIYELQRRYSEFYYFPAYELVMDDLRDYRFFAEDMLHPNHQASQYVWEVLCETILSSDTQHLLKDIGEILLAARHRPRNPDSEAHKKFVRKMLAKIEKLKVELSADFDKEEKMLTAYM